jgi:hypothetical protein
MQADVADVLLVGLWPWLAADFVADLTDWLLVGLWAWLAADFVADLTDWLLVGLWTWLAADNASGCSGCVVGGAIPTGVFSDDFCKMSIALRLENGIS